MTPEQVATVTELWRPAKQVTVTEPLIGHLPAGWVLVVVDNQRTLGVAPDGAAHDVHHV